MRHGLVALRDVAQNRDVGIGYVKYTPEPGVLCAHKWVLDHNFVFQSTGLEYRPMGEVSPGEAEARLSARWASDSRLVVCQARVLELPSATAPHLFDPFGSGEERIQFCGVWPVLRADEKVGYVFVPFVEEHAPLLDEVATQAGHLAGKRVSLARINRYAEHWTFLAAPFAMLDATFVVARSDAPSNPKVKTFFEDLKGLAAAIAPSYAEVMCATYVEAV